MVTGLGGCQTKTTEDSIDEREIKLIDLRKVMDDQRAARDKPILLLVDPRSPKDFAKGHLADARNMPLQSIPDRKGELDKRLEAYDRVVVYGEDRGSAVARAMAKRMLAVGYDNIYVFMGGLEEWRRANLPVPQSPEPK